MVNKRKIPRRSIWFGVGSKPTPQGLSRPIMKEDILEQLVDDYLQLRGYFTRHNVKFRPRNDHPQFVKEQDSNHSDIDVIGYHPQLAGAARVWVVSCKSWQAGFSVNSKILELESDKIQRRARVLESVQGADGPEVDGGLYRRNQAGNGRDKVYIRNCGYGSAW